MKLAFALFLSLLSVASKADVAAFNGVVDPKTGFLTLSLKNTSSRSLCIGDWIYPDNEYPVVPVVDEYLIEDESGRAVAFDGAVLMPASLSKSHFFVILSPGSEIKKVIELPKGYRLSKGEYTLTYFKSVVDCRAFSKEQLNLESSLYLKFVYLNSGKDFSALNSKVDQFGSSVWREYGAIVSIEKLHFSVLDIYR